MARPDDNDVMLSALVQLVESQAERIDGMRRAIVDLQARLQARLDMDVMLAHEVRTPLTVVTGVLSALDAPLTDDERADLLRRGLAQAEHLTELVADMLKPPADGETAFPRARLRTVAVRTLVDQAVDAVSTRLDTSRVVVDVDPSLLVSTAPSRLVAVVVNLLENAAKYGDGSPVEVTARFEPDRRLVLAVADRGPGLAGADPESLFAAFARGRETMGVPGRGVGLYLVRMLARSLGGNATLVERTGGGTVAEVWLPQRRTDDPKVAPVAPVVVTGDATSR
jgi:signal transduction histidine kinase